MENQRFGRHFRGVGMCNLKGVYVLELHFYKHLLEIGWFVVQKWFLNLHLIYKIWNN